MTKLAQVVMILFIIFECQYMETFREMGESPALEFAPMTEWIFYVICTASSLIKHMTLCCVRLLWYTTGKIWIAYLGLWFCSVHINQHNSCLQHFLKQILNTTCSFVVLLVFFKWGNWYECLLDIITALTRWTREERKLCTELERRHTENKMFWQCVWYHHLPWLSHINYDIL